jgi:hypothetical protein
MKKIVTILISTIIISCNQGEKPIKEENTKIGTTEVKALKIKNKLWVFDDISMINLFKSNIEIYTDDQVRDFLIWKKDGDNRGENDEYEVKWPQKPWVVKMSTGNYLFSDTAITYLKSRLPKNWRFPTEKDLKELDDMNKKDKNYSNLISKYFKFDKGYTCEWHMIMEIHGTFLDCAELNEEYSIWLDNNEIFWFRKGSPVFDKNDYIYSNHFDVFASPLILIKDNL